MVRLEQGAEGLRSAVSMSNACTYHLFWRERGCNILPQVQSVPGRVYLLHTTIRQPEFWRLEKYTTHRKIHVRIRIRNTRKTRHAITHGRLRWPQIGVVRVRNLFSLSHVFR